MRTIVIALPSLVSEGTPHMALDLCRIWSEQGIRSVIFLLDGDRDELRPEFERLDVPIVPARLGSGHMRFLRLALQSFAIVRRYRAQGVVSMLFGWHAWIGLGARPAGAGVLAHVGNHPGGLPPATHAKLTTLVRIGNPVTRAVVCCSDYVREAVVRAFPLPPARTHVVYNGVRIEDFPPVPERAQRSGPPVLTMVARLEVHKDQATLIRAAALLRDRGTAVEVRLIGDGTRRAELEALAVELGVTDRVRFLGFRNDIAQQLSETDLFVFSTTPDEGLGIALIEAMVARVPIVASDVGACRETLDRSACGLLVPPADAEALADGITQALADPETPARIEAAHARALAEFDARAMADKYLKLVLGIA